LQHFPKSACTQLGTCFWLVIPQPFNSLAKAHLLA
jgi:hypothetical protein